MHHIGFVYIASTAVRRSSFTFDLWCTSIFLGILRLILYLTLCAVLYVFLFLYTVVLSACASAAVRSSLPVLQRELEKCQRGLGGYLAGETIDCTLDTALYIACIHVHACNGTCASELVTTAVLNQRIHLSDNPLSLMCLGQVGVRGSSDSTS